MSGIQEILIVILIVLGIFFIPRMIGKNATIQQVPVHRRFRVSGPMRLAIAVSILWPLGAVIYYRPWEDATTPFYAYGLGPVLIGWCLYWVLAGFKGREKK